MDNSKSRLLLLIAASCLVALFVLAIFYVLRMDTEDPSVTASYKNLRKRRKLESPLPADLSADFQLTHDGQWLATGPVKDPELKNLAKKHQFLDSMSILGGELTADGIAVLKDRHIRELKIQYMPMNLKFADTLSTFSELKSLDLRDKSIDDEFLKHLTGLPALRNLHLYDSKITIDGVKYLVKTFPRLEDVEVSKNPKFDNDCLSLLNGLKNLYKIDVSGTSVTEDALLTFLKTASITKLGIGDLHLNDAFVAKLPKNLLELELSYNPITDASIETVSAMKKLQTFRLVGKSKVTNVGLNKLRKKLPACSVYATRSKNIDL